MAAATTPSWPDSTLAPRSNLTLVYSTYLGGVGNDYGNAIAVDTAGNAYVTGSTSSTNFPCMIHIQPVLSGSSDAFVAKLNPGVPLCSTPPISAAAVPMPARALPCPRMAQRLCDRVNFIQQFSPVPNATFQSNYGGGSSDAFVARIFFHIGGTIAINEGAQYTKLPPGKLGPHSQSRRHQNAFSNETGAYSGWEDFAATKSWTLSDGDGPKTVNVQFQDASGDTSQQPISGSIILDTTPPTDTSININDGDAYTRSTAVTLTLAASDAKPSITMCFSNDGTTYTSPWENYATSRAYNLPTGDGAKTVYVKFKDAAGNISTPVSSSIILDNTPPSGTSIKINNDDAYTRSTAVTLTLAAGDANPPITMCFSNDGTTYTSPWENYATSRPYNLPTGDGAKTVYVKFKDAAGNISTPVSSSIILDNTPPSGTSIKINNDDAYTRSTAVTLTLAAGDANPPITMCFSNDGTTYTSPWENYATSRPYNLPTGDGSKTVYVKFKDAAGNISTPVSSSIILDNTAPTGTSININNGDAYTRSTAVTLTLAAGDANPPITMCFSNDGTTYTSPWENYATSRPYNLPTGDGSKTVYVKFKDAAGNISTPVSNSIILDNTPPTGTSISINNGDAYTRSTAVTLTLAAGDANPPITMCFSNDGTTYTSPWENYATSRPYNLPTGDGSKTVYVKFQDAAGNISTPVSQLHHPGQHHAHGHQYQYQQRRRLYQIHGGNLDPGGRRRQSAYHHVLQQ